MTATSQTIVCATQGNDHILDLTGELLAVVDESGIETGQATAMVVGSTAALSTLEYEPGLVTQDIAAALEKIAPRDGRYLHEETWHDDNGHSHVSGDADRAFARPPDRERHPAPRHVAAGGVDRFRHPAARATRGRRVGRQLR